MSDLHAEALALEATNPATSQERLAELAHLHPELRAAIAAHPSTYDALRAWIAANTEASPAVAMNPLAAPSSVPPTGPRTLTRGVPLRWGTYRLRYWISFSAFAVGIGLPHIAFLAEALSGNGYWFLSASSFVAMLALVLSVVSYGAAIVVHPTTGTRRGIASAIMGLTTIVVFAVTLMNGFFLATISSGILGVLLALAWFVLRSHPGISYLALLFGLLYYPIQRLWFIPILQSPLEMLVLGVMVLVGALISRRTQPRAASPALLTAEQRATTEHEQRVAHLQQWEDAYRSLHNGEAPPAGYIPPMPQAATPSDKTNTIAILALVFGIGGGLLGIIFGHMARAQIRRTGEQGWGLATAGLVLGYVGLAAGLLLAIGYVVLIVAIR